jgi:hypothetical protein
MTNPLPLDQAFPLVVGEISGNRNVLNGFSKDILAESFNVEEDLIEEVQSKPPDRLVKAPGQVKKLIESCLVIWALVMLSRWSRGHILVFYNERRGIISLRRFGRN